MRIGYSQEDIRQFQYTVKVHSDGLAMSVIHCILYMVFCCVKGATVAF